MNKYKAVKVTHGKGGWGGPLIIIPDEKKKYIACVVGGGIPEVAKKIAKLTGATPVDSYKNPVETEETLCAVIDCGGTARCGTYPKLGIPTMNVKLQEPSGPLAKYMTADIFVSGVTTADVKLVDPDNLDIELTVEEDITETVNEEEFDSNDEYEDTRNPVIKAIDKVGRIAGSFINIMYQSGRDTINTMINNIIPFMAFVATIMGIIKFTGIGDYMARGLIPLSDNIFGLVILGLITGIPFLSPLLAPGAVMAAIVGTLIGAEIAKGTIPPHYALPALFAINSQVGCDFAPVGMTLGEAKPDTISIGVPAILFSRLITGPIAVILAYFCSFGL